MDIAVEKIILIQFSIILLFSIISIIFYTFDDHYDILGGFFLNSGQ